MNLLFLVEGAKTEPKIYQAWLQHLFPQLTFVAKPEEMTTHCCRIIIGCGYPSMVCQPRASNAPSRLEACLIDIQHSLRTWM